MEEIDSLVQFAHCDRACIFVTMNTILHNAELDLAPQQVWQLYEADVDALIVQDMGCSNSKATAEVFSVNCYSCSRFKIPSKE